MFAFCDYDCTTYVENRKSISGYSNKISDSLVSWKWKKKQYTRSRSSIKAEYGCMGVTISEIVWLSGLFDELSVIRLKFVLLSCDNRVAL